MSYFDSMWQNRNQRIKYLQGEFQLSLREAFQLQDGEKKGQQAVCPSAERPAIPGMPQGDPGLG